MQEAIIQIGDIILEKGNMLDNLVVELEPIKKKKQLYVMKMNFCTEQGTLDIDVKEEMNENSANKYLYIGSVATSASPQWYVSSTSYMYHITETFPNLVNRDFGEVINEKIKLIKENFFVDLGEDFKNNKNRFILNFKKLGFSCEAPEDLYKTIYNEEKEKLERGEGKKKDFQKNLKDRLKKKFNSIFEDYVKNEKGLNPKQIGLYTIFIDGNPLCELKEYREALLKDKQKGTEKNSDSEKSKKQVVKDKHHCSVCGGEENLTHDIANDIKFYTTNQLIFASGLNKNNYCKNMLLCKECLGKLLVGEKYIKNNLKTSLTGFPVYIVPHFIIGETLNTEELDQVCKKVNHSFNAIKNYDSVGELREEIENAIDFKNEKTYFLINFIFYKITNKATKVQRLIKDVNPSIFEEIGEALIKTNDLYKRFFQSNYERNISLGKAYNLTPIRQKKGEAMQYKNLLNIYDSVLSKKTIKKSHMISNILDTIKIQYFEEQGFNVSSGAIHHTIMDGNMYIKFLEYLGCIKEESPVEINKLQVDNTMKEYVEEMNYNEMQMSLFILGYLIGEVGNAQRKRSKEGKKPILNKLNFGGIDKSKLIRLTGEVFNKLKQEKILKYNEINFGECKRLMDKNLSNWSLNKQENLFYILTGYGYATNKFMLNKDSQEMKGEVKDEQ